MNHTACSLASLSYARSVESAGEKGRKEVVSEPGPAQGERANIPILAGSSEGGAEDRAVPGG